MSKRICFERAEDVRVKYRWSMIESEWPDFIEWAKDEYPGGTEILSTLTFDEAVETLHNREATSITWQEVCWPGSTDTYSQSLEDAICHYLRDFAIDAGPVDEDYYDDGCDEYISIEELPF